MRAALLAAGLLALAAPAFAADPVVGDWVPPDGGSKIRIAPCADNPALVCGKIAWLPASTAKNLDTNNPKADLKTARPGPADVLGIQVDDAGKWTGGKLYDPSSGKTYSGKLTAAANNTLKVEGCVLGICQAQTWKRAC
jgi:uncharacterized protein (DUF2147 family)